MSDDQIQRIMNCLSVSITDNQITNIESLSWAISKLENYSMTLAVLESSRIGQRLQAVRQCARISRDMSVRIRHLIKCWRLLLLQDACAPLHSTVTPSLCLFRCQPSAPGHNNDSNNNNQQQLHNRSSAPDTAAAAAAPRPDAPVNTERSDEAADNNGDSIGQSMIDRGGDRNCHGDGMVNGASDLDPPDGRMGDWSESGGGRARTLPAGPETVVTGDSGGGESAPRPSVAGKPRLKSTKELLADFSSLIDADTSQRILENRITQEDDDATSYHPDEWRIREIISTQILHGQENGRSLSRVVADDDEEEEDRDREEGELERRAHAVTFEREQEQSEQESLLEIIKPDSKCDKLLQQFLLKCSESLVSRSASRTVSATNNHAAVVLQPLIPWRNLKRGINCSGPCIRQPKTNKRLVNELNGVGVDPSISINEINELLENFELRAKRKDLIREAIEQRKQSEMSIVDNTQSIVDSLPQSLKLKLKINPQIIIRKLKKKRRKKKKKKLKSKKAPPPKIAIKKPRKPRVKPKPPITNYLDDLPLLPDLSLVPVPSPIEHDAIDGGEEGDLCRLGLLEEGAARRLSYELIEGYNCTKHPQTMELLDYCQMYSVLLDSKTYLHVFPWVDLQYSCEAMFCAESDQIIQAALELPQLFS